MAKTSAPTRSPRGTNIIINAFTEAMNAQPDRWQKAAGLAALQKLTTTLKSMPTWQEPQETSTRGTKSTQKSGYGSKSRASKTSSAKSGSGRGRRSTQGGVNAGSSGQSTTQSTSANSVAHPDQQV